jgi:hypothetical protein
MYGVFQRVWLKWDWMENIDLLIKQEKKWFLVSMIKI